MNCHMTWNKQTSCVVVSVSLIAMSILLSACSDDPVQPAPVYMMGRTTQADTYWRDPAAVSTQPHAGQAVHTAALPSPPIPARKPASSATAAHMATPRKSVTASANRNTTGRRIARAEAIQLEEPALRTPESSAPGTAPTSFGPTNSSWVSPAPADPPQTGTQQPSH